MPLQGRDLLATDQVPETNVPVRASQRQQSPARRERGATGVDPLVLGELPELLAGGNLPDLERTIQRGRHELPAIRGEDDHVRSQIPFTDLEERRAVSRIPQTHG